MGMMVKPGEIRKGSEIGKIKDRKYVWCTCIRCGKERWVQIKMGQPRSTICADCVRNFTAVVCARCHRRWRGAGSPARCPDCGYTSYPIVLRVNYRKEFHAERRAIGKEV